MATATEISIKDVGPIKKLSIPIPAGGGVVVLRGPNGSGKSNALVATETLIRGGGKSLDVRDDALKGEVSGFGARLNVARRTVLSGELDVVSLEGRLDVSQVVDPGIKEPGAADAKRIKALLSLSGLTPDPAEFMKLAKDEAEWLSVVSQADIAPEKCTDFVELAARIKRDFEKSSRKAEEQAENYSREAQAKKESSKGVDAADAKPGALLLKAYNDASGKLAELKERHRLAAETLQSREEARHNLEAAKASYEGPTTEEAEDLVKLAEHNQEACIEDVKRIEASLLAAKARLKDSTSELHIANERYTSARNHEASLRGWQQSIESGAIADVPEEEITAATKAVEEAHSAMERGAVARKALESLEEGNRLAQLALEAKSQANRLRDAAKGTDEVLSSLVERVGSNLKVEAGRLITQHKRGGDKERDTYFADLSDGERWRIGLDIATSAVGEHGVIVVPQIAWEGLDGGNRKVIADHAKLRNVVVITAEATKDEETGEISAEIV